MSKPELTIELCHAHSQSYVLATIEWPFDTLPVIGSQIYGCGIDEALDGAEVVLVSFHLADAGSITIVAQRMENRPFQYRDELDRAAAMLKAKGWRVNVADAPLKGKPWEQGDS